MVRYTKYTGDNLEEHEFTFMLMSRQYKSLYDVNLLNRKIESRIQEQEINQSIWTMQRFDKKDYALYMQMFYPIGACLAELPFKSNKTIIIKNNDEECLLWCLIAYLHPANHHPNRLSNYKKPE